MMGQTDFYRQRLAHAKWTWREDNPRRGRKDRGSGRAEKHRAVQAERRDMERDRWP